VSTIPLEQGLVWEPTWKALPSSGQLRKKFRSMSEVLKAKDLKPHVSWFNVYPYEISAWVYLMQLTHKMGEEWSQGALWMPFTRFALDPLKKMRSGWSLDWFERGIGPRNIGYERIVTGRLAFSLEGAGKRRIFAIGNYMNQRLLRPVHDWLANI
jgi:hypothetical protein